jgi:acid phosphatase
MTSSTIWADEPPNLDQIKQKLIQYHDSGQYKKDVQAVVERATAYLKKRVKENQQLDNPQQLAVVFDIDDTVLSNYAHIKELNFGGRLQTIKKFEAKGTDPAIEPTLKLYKLARDHDVAVFFVTGRNERHRQVTIENLKKAGFTEWAGLYLKPNDYKPKSASKYKRAIRKKIEDQGYEIIMNIGDQPSDLKGGYADKNFKLPNPFYRIP